ncbi:hypothetical protein [Sphingobium nicotianae]|uniref:Phytoene synthase n=1 Tax=Sphingobium nicotianae TaxID=2782607 RepID=A0A9X1DD41_9SPHN|nr:hypothetical protein [Sphingobium nicotianae]MBT2187732.1 hypothetical protein [Sphingobium nicotianae]
MNALENGAVSPADLAPLPRLLLAYAPAEMRDWHGLCWLLDQRLAAVAQRGGDATIAAIRLAWWDAVLVENDLSKGRGEPLVERWRLIAPAGMEQVAGQLIDGWRALVAPEAMSEEDLLAYGEARGGGLFGLLAGDAQAAQGRDVRSAGCLWALWDLAAHVRDESLARRAVATAREVADRSIPPAGAGFKPLRLARALALADVRTGRVPRGGFSPRHYGRLLLASLRG